MVVTVNTQLKATIACQGLGHSGMEAWVMHQVRKLPAKVLAEVEGNLQWGCWRLLMNMNYGLSPGTTVGTSTPPILNLFLGIATGYSLENHQWQSGLNVEPRRTEQYKGWTSGDALLCPMPYPHGPIYFSLAWYTAFGTLPVSYLKSPRESQSFHASGLSLKPQPGWKHSPKKPKAIFNQQSVGIGR